MAGKYPHEIYVAVVHAIQSEWVFLQHMTKDTGQSFAVVGKVLWETFSPCLFFGIYKTFLPIVGVISVLPVNKFRLGLQNPVT